MRFLKYYSILFCFLLGLLLVTSCKEKQKGLKGDFKQLIGLSISKGSNILNAQSAVFDKDDVGKTIIVYLAGTGSDGSVGDELITSIKSYKSKNKVILSDKAANTVEKVGGGFGTDNSSFVQKILLKKDLNKNTFSFPDKGTYLFIQKITLKNLSDIIVDGKHATIAFISSNPNSYISGRQPKQDLFDLYRCNNITFKNLKVINIGQTDSRPNTLKEGGYWKTLNKKPVPYNRRYNKQANNGAFVKIQESQNIHLDNIEAKEVGSLFSVRAGNKADLAKGGSIKNCKVFGWGASAVHPVHNMLVQNNLFDNQSAPALSSHDQNQHFGTSHAIYSVAGYGNITISNNKFYYCRGTTIQFNTGATKSCVGNKIHDNQFRECHRNGSIYGDSNPLEIRFSNNQYTNCGRWNIGQKNARLFFENESASGQPSENAEYKGFLSFTAVDTLVIQNSTFNGVVDAGNVAVLQMSSHKARNDGFIHVDNCKFDNNNVRAFMHLLDHKSFHGICKFTNNTFGAEVRLVGLKGRPKKVSGAGKNKFIFENNVFNGQQSPQLVASFGVTLKGNKHILKSKFPGIKFDLLEGAGDANIEACEFINDGTSDPIIFSKAKANLKNVSLTGCVFSGKNQIKKKRKFWIKEQRNQQQ